NSSSRAHRRCELRCAIAHRGIHMDELLCFKHSQEFLCLFTCREAAYLNVVRVVLRRAWRTQSDELTAMPPDNLRQVLAVEWRHIPRAAPRTLVVARAGPLISPYPFATITSVEIEKPSHPNLLGPQTIIAPRNEINETAIPQILKLLTYLGL